MSISHRINSPSSARSLYSDEPETIAWIDSFVDQDVFWDIGANVGIYSIYAAARPSMTVLAFEPAAANYSVLCRSIELNGMDDRVLAYCLALNDHKNVGRFSMRRTKAGIAKSSFDVAAIHKNQDRIKFRQAMIGYTIDDFIEEFDAPFPHHIKIDVDGNDHLVLAGATRTLADRRVKSVLVELVGGKCDREREASAMRILLAAGLTLDPKSEEARHNRIFWRS